MLPVEEQLKVIEDYMEQHDKWTVDKNCSYWSVHLWNAVVDKDFSRAGDIYCYKDGERTELQLCS